MQGYAYALNIWKIHGRKTYILKSLAKKSPQKNLNNFPSHVNHFKSFLDNLHTIYHRLFKNAEELKVHAEELDTPVLKIGRILDTRRNASNFRTVSVVCKNFEVLVAHFKSAKEDHKQ